MILTIMFIPNSFCTIGKSLHDLFKNIFSLNVLHIEPFNGFNQFVNEFFFFFTVLDYCVFFGLNMLFKNCNIDSKWGEI